MYLNKFKSFLICIISILIEFKNIYTITDRIFVNMFGIFVIYIYIYRLKHENMGGIFYSRLACSTTMLAWAAGKQRHSPCLFSFSKGKCFFFFLLEPGVPFNFRKIFVR